MHRAFDHMRYLDAQGQAILERVAQYQKLYLEFWGKLFSDLHAQRVLPGFIPDAKIALLQQLRDRLEVIICVYAWDITHNKIRADLERSYDQEVFELIDRLRWYGLQVHSVVITRFEESPSVLQFIAKLEQRGICVFKHYAIAGYPMDVERIVSEDGYWKNPYIPTSQPIVVVTGAWAGSWKLATCLSQLYHEYCQGNEAGYAKFETFPVWDLPLQHPLNLAYEAATLDLEDVNMIDPFHFEAYGKIATNYNRDVEAFPLLQRILQKITKTDCVYRSPTDMGVNRITSGIIDESAVKLAAEQEIISRYLKLVAQHKKGHIGQEIVQKAQLLLEKIWLNEEQRPVLCAARARLAQLEHQASSSSPVVLALQLYDGMLITGKRSELMDAPAAAVLNALKYLSACPDEVLLLDPAVLEPIAVLKSQFLQGLSLPLELEEVLIALSISAVHDTRAQLALQQLPKLEGAQGHATSFLSHADHQVLTKLGINITCDPVFTYDYLSDF